MGGTLAEMVPESSYYFLHPSLQKVISRHNNDYRITPSVIIGSGYKWYELNMPLLEIDKIIKDNKELLRELSKNISKILSEYSHNDEAEDYLKILNDAKKNIDEMPYELEFHLEQFFTIFFDRESLLG